MTKAEKIKKREAFVKRVEELHEKGLSIKQIADILVPEKSDQTKLWMGVEER